MRIFFRILLALEVTSTVIAGTLAMIRPIDFLPTITSAAAGAAAPDLARMLGAAWIVVGLILAGVPFLEDVRTMRSVLIAIMIGDVLHIAALIPSGGVDATHIVPSVLFFSYRGAAVWRPQWLIRTEPS
jgi:hypothetical protein